MNKYILIILFLLIIPWAQACDDGQVDINKADAEELEALYGVGPVTAEKIIDERPFETLDDLINVYGIGEVKLATIKSQGLACIEEEPEEEDSEEDVEKESEEVEEKPKGPKIFQKIRLTAQTIKSEDGMEKDKDNLALWGLLGFAFLLIVLFAMRGKRYKNEFG